LALGVLVHRINPETGEVLVPHVFDDNAYGAADPSLGKKRHHIANRVVAASIEELKEYLRKGWPVWMSIRGTRDRRLISKGIIDTDPPQAERDLVPQAKIVTAQPLARMVERKPVQSVPVAPARGPVAGRVTEYLQIVASMSQAEIAAETDNPRRLLMGTHVHKSKRLDIAYAPFDHVSIGADIIIVGITPGKQQMREALEEARLAMMLGQSDAEVLARAKVHASFAGTMRSNLVKLMDAVGLNVLLGIASTASLWGVDSHRAHFTSAIRYSTFVNGENYSRSPDMNGVPFLFDRSRNWLGEELSLFSDAVIVPMGDMVSEALTRIGPKMAISNNRILVGMPHASGANNGPISKFLGNAGEDDEWRRRFVDITAKVRRFCG
jgi:hypothetical protein